MARKASRKTSSILGRFTRSASKSQSDMLGMAGSLFRGRQSAGADKIASVAEATRRLSEDLSDMPSVQGYVESAADQMEYLSDYVAENTLEQMVDDGSAFARRHPVSTVAFAIALGYGFTKLLTHESAEETRSKPLRKTPVKTASRPARRKRTAARTTKAKANGRVATDGAARAS